MFLFPFFETSYFGGAMMKSFLESILSLALCMFFVVFLSTPVCADYNITGDVSPTNPGKWTDSTLSFIGNISDGSLIVNGDSDFISLCGFIGYEPGITGVVDLEGNGTTWTSATIWAGFMGKGNLNIRNGSAASSSDIEIGYTDGSGIINVDGKGSKLTNNFSLNITSGSLNTTNGGSVNWTDPAAFYCIGCLYGLDGSATVDGAGSKWVNIPEFYVGYASDGTVNITNGATVTSYSSSNCYLGYDVASTGTINVDGTGTYFGSFSNIQIGCLGNGTLNIKHGGAIINGSCEIGLENRGYANVSGTGSKWTNSDLLCIGKNNFGELNISNGGNVVSRLCRIGSDEKSNGFVTIDGAGSSLNIQNQFIIGNLGIGKLVITNGGTVSSVYSYIGSDLNSTGEVTVDGIGSNWTNGSSLIVGHLGNGTLNISNNAIVKSNSCYISDRLNQGKSGRVNVDGAGSFLSVGYLSVGEYGNGTLNIFEGGKVNVASATIVADYEGSMGSINLGMGGGTLTTGSLLASPNQITGNGIINADGLVSDCDLVFDSRHDLNQTFLFNQATFNLSLPSSSSLAHNTILGAGYFGNGSLSINDGKMLFSSEGYIGYHSGSSGLVTVDGIGSTWTCNNLQIGKDGHGKLIITNGGSVYGEKGEIRGNRNSSSTVIVDGIGSKITDSSIFSIRSFSTLNVSGGGVVSAKSVYMDGNALLSIDVGKGSKLTIDNGAGTLIVLYGVLRVSAGMSPAANTTYTPIAGIWDSRNDETVQDLGGKWNSTTHEFTVSAVQPGDSGMAVNIDRLSTQRVLIGDSATQWKLGASFVSTASSAPLSFTATAISDGPLDALSGKLADDERLLGGWNLSATTGYTAGDPVYLSFALGTGKSYGRDALQLWSYDGSAWSKFSADDITSDGAYASFTTTRLGTFALTVPEPGTFLLLAFAFVGAAAVAWKRWR
jgi:fibronectin-binding autotransporter adhesin